MSNSRECKYSWVGSNSRVINYLSLARPFPSPSPFQMATLFKSSMPCHLNFTQLNANSKQPFYFPLKTTYATRKPYRTNNQHRFPDPTYVRPTTSNQIQLIQFWPKSTMAPPSNSSNHAMLPNPCPIHQLIFNHCQLVQYYQPSTQISTCPD